MGEITQLNIEKAVADAITRAESDDRRTVTVGGAATADELRATASVETGSGWTLAALFRRFRKTSTNEFGVNVSKHF